MFIANHLWQSTLFAAAAGLLTLALRRNRASVRYAIWFAASIKFLIPFSWLISSGSRIHWRTVEAEPATSFDFGRFAQPFSSPTGTLAAVDVAPYVLAALWLAGSLAVSALWLMRWRGAKAAVRSGTLMGPGVFGLFRPVLLLPDGIAQRLSEEQLRMVVAHEICHIRRRDNLTAAIHMLVQAAFWFHPLVWWIGARMLRERELACDEAVLAQGYDAGAYAEAILKICRYYLESPLPCVSGVTGSSLKDRVRTIMNHRAPAPLNRAKRAVLAMATTSAVAGPIAFGVWNSPLAIAQPGNQQRIEFEAATIKPSPRNVNGMGIGSGSTDFRASNQTLQDLLWFAQTGEYANHGMISGGPAWTSSERFDIQGKAKTASTQAQMRRMILSLLEDRFKLRFHFDEKQMPVYALVLANSSGKLGPGLKPATPEESAFCEAFAQKTSDEDPGFGPDRIRRCGGSGMGGIRIRAQPISALGTMLAELMNRTVIDRTGLQGRYNINLLGNFAWPEPFLETGPPPAEANTNIFGLLQDQLGLKLESTRGPVRTIVIDSAERPSEN